MTSKSSFNDTARYWTQIYAGAGGKDKPTTTAAALSAGGADPQDPVAMAGLEKAHVDQFEGLGFDRTKVVSVPLRSSHSRG